MLFISWVRSPRLLAYTRLWNYFETPITYPEAQTYCNAGDGNDSVERRVCDYIAGMTDSYAEKIYGRLFVPGQGSSHDEL